MSKFVTRFLKGESGATAIEYSLIATLLALVIIGGLSAISADLNNTFASVAASLK